MGLHLSLQLEDGNGARIGTKKTFSINLSRESIDAVKSFEGEKMAAELRFGKMILSGVTVAISSLLLDAKAYLCGEAIAR